MLRYSDGTGLIRCRPVLLQAGANVLKRQVMQINSDREDGLYGPSLGKLVQVVIQWNIGKNG